MNLQDFNHLLHAGKFAYEVIHKAKEFIDSFDETFEIKQGNCEKCNHKSNLEISLCCSTKLCFNCNKCNKGSYCRMCHLA